MTTEVNAAAAAGDLGASQATDPRAAAGGAHQGSEHWWHERLSSLAVLLLYVWLAVSLLRLPNLDHAMIADWLSSPLAAVPMLLLVAATFWHIRLGLQVIVDDYVHDEGAKLFWTILIAFGSALAAAFALFSVLKIAL